jgi:hypothetical protein
LNDLVEQPKLVASLRDQLEQLAAHAERVGDPAAGFMRSLVIRCDIEQQRDDRVEQMLETAEHIAGGAIAAKTVKELPGAIDRQVVQRYWLYGMAAAAVAVLAVAGGIAGGIQLYNSGWADGHSSRVAEVEHAVDGLQTAATQHGPEGAEDWLTLMRYNDIKHVDHHCFQQSDRTACVFALWAGPPPPPTEQQTAQTQTAMPAPAKHR